VQRGTSRRFVPPEPARLSWPTQSRTRSYSQTDIEEPMRDLTPLTIHLSSPLYLLGLKCLRTAWRSFLRACAIMRMKRAILQLRGSIWLMYQFWCPHTILVPHGIATAATTRRGKGQGSRSHHRTLLTLVGTLPFHATSRCAQSITYILGCTFMIPHVDIGTRNPASRPMQTERATARLASDGTSRGVRSGVQHQNLQLVAHLCSCSC
jgi:hypothetical protein